MADPHLDRALAALLAQRLTGFTALDPVTAALFAAVRDQPALRRLLGAGELRALRARVPRCPPDTRALVVDTLVAIHADADDLAIIDACGVDAGLAEAYAAAIAEGAEGQPVTLRDLGTAMSWPVLLGILRRHHPDEHVAMIAAAGRSAPARIPLRS